MSTFVKPEHVMNALDTKRREKRAMPHVAGGNAGNRGMQQRMDVTSGEVFRRTADHRRRGHPAAPLRGRDAQAVARDSCDVSQRAGL